MSRLTDITIAIACLIAAACTKVEVESIVFPEKLVTVTAGRAVMVNYAVYPEAAGRIELDWTSDNPAVATANKGYILGIAPGSCTVTASHGKISETITVTVEAVKVYKASFSPKSLSIKAGGSASFEVGGIDPDYATASDIFFELDSEGRQHFSLSSPSGNNVTVQCLAGTPDGARGKVYCSGYGDNALGEISLIAVNRPVTSVTVNPTTAIRYVGESFSISASVNPSNTTDDVNIEWSSSNTGVATVTSEGGKAVVTAVGTGTATITARERGSSKSAGCTLTVKEKRKYESLTPGFYSKFIYNSNGTSSVAGLNNFTTRLIPGGISLYMYLGYSDGFAISREDHQPAEFTVSITGDFAYTPTIEESGAYYIPVQLSRNGGSGTVTVSHPSWKSPLSKSFTSGFGSVTMEKIDGSTAWSGFVKNSTTVAIGGQFTVTRSSTNQTIAFCLNAGDHVQWQDETSSSFISNSYSRCGWLSDIYETSGTLPLDTYCRLVIKSTTPAGTYTFSLRKYPEVTWTLVIKS